MSKDLRSSNASDLDHAGTLTGAEIIGLERNGRDYQTTATAVAALGGGGGGLHLWDAFFDVTGVSVTSTPAPLPWILRLDAHHDDLLNLTDTTTPTFLTDGVYVVTTATYVIAWAGVAEASLRQETVLGVANPDAVYYGSRNPVNPVDVGGSLNLNTVTSSRYFDAGEPLFVFADTPAADPMTVGLVAHVTKLSG